MPEKAMKQVPKNTMIVAQDQYYDLDCYKTKRNNNLLVVGAAGAGKTRSIVIPNILQATGSYVISDPKGNLYKEYRGYLESKGYVTRLLNFENPKESIKYNVFRYIHSEMDILKVAHMLVHEGGAHASEDAFWDDAAESLLTCIMAYLWEFRPKEEQNMDSVLKLLEAAAFDREDISTNSTFDRIMEDVGKRASSSFTYRSYRRYRIGAGRTKASILIVLATHLSKFGIAEVRALTSDDQTRMADIGRRKTAFFVQVSDTDRSMDNLANLFFTQAMNELCREADEHYKDYRLPYDVRFILDDFATNCMIHEFPRMISSIRSRGISTMLMIQAESQLEKGYGDDAKTIIANCDTYAYLGGNDTQNAEEIAKRANLPLDKILYMPVETEWIFRRGEKPIYTKTFDLEEFTSKQLPKGYEIGR